MPVTGGGRPSKSRCTMPKSKHASKTVAKGPEPSTTTGDSPLQLQPLDPLTASWVAATKLDRLWFQVQHGWLFHRLSNREFAFASELWEELAVDIRNLVKPATTKDLLQGIVLDGKRRFERFYRNERHVEHLAAIASVMATVLRRGREGFEYWAVLEEIYRGTTPHMVPWDRIMATKLRRSLSEELTEMQYQAFRLAALVDQAQWPVRLFAEICTDWNILQMHSSHWVAAAESYRDDTGLSAVKRIEEWKWFLPAQGESFTKHFPARTLVYEVTQRWSQLGLPSDPLESAFQRARETKATTGQGEDQRDRGDGWKHS